MPRLHHLPIQAIPQINDTVFPKLWNRFSTLCIQLDEVVTGRDEENSGVVAEGSFQPDGSFVATNILAKHDERYMPPQVAMKNPEMHESKSLQK